MHLNLLSIIIPLRLFLNEILWSVATTNSPVLYHPLDNITVNCGSSGNSTAADGRQWTGDIGSNYSPLLHSNRGKLFSSKATKPPLSPDPVPYMSARLSRQPFTYTFQVSPGQKFIRLYFYPASYRGGFKRSKAFFTVKAGPYTLLSNFSASLTADALGLESLVKEYCVNVEENQPLILTLSPSLGGSSDEAYAFVNGIEIVSMPTGLYHTREGDAGAMVVGENFRFPIGKSIALEMVQRLNVGGSSISSIEDTGMFRDWSQDSYYFMEKSNVQPVTTTLRVKYTSIPSYTAPQKVYQTSWSMVIDKQGNGTFNFTWKFPIDLGFRYLLRLHFCDFEYEREESDRTKFSIFVNEHVVVEAEADIMKWDGNRVAVYRDYVVMMEGDRKQGKHDLLIAYFPHNHEWTEQIDTILKGLEVFKMSNPDKNLAGVNPVPLSCASTSSNAKPRKFVYASGGNAIATVLVILLTTTNISVYMLRVWGEKFNEKNTSPLLPEGLCRRFSLSEVLEVTNNFNDEFVIGRGGFGNVYKALIDDGRTIVAIKRLNSKSKQGADEFWTEIEMLSNLRHTHLVSLIGYCDEQQEMILVYEYIEHGTLADHLYKHGNGTICNTSWKQRMKACIGAARGLDYLHTGTRRGIIHRDVKTTNILLDKDWVAKISDFGLCKEGTTCQLCKEGTTCHSHTYHVSTMVKGTFGYMDPEYFFTRRLTKKSDVYAFGVVLLEVLCGRPAVDLGVEEEQRSLALWAQQCMKEEKHDQLIDPILKDQISPECLKVFTEVANKCLHKHPSGRPTMTDVVASLECMLASLEQPRNACTEEEEEEEEKLDDEEDEEEDVNVHGDSDQRIYDDKNTQQNDILPQSTVASPSAPVHFNGNTQRQKRSKKNLFQRGIAFLARSIDNQISDVEIQTTAANKIIFQGMSPTTNTTPSNEGNISGTIFENSDGGGGATLSLPPIASNKPILAMLGSSIASVRMGQLRDRIDAAYNLALLARDNDRNKKMIVEEGGVGPLLKLLKEGASAEAQIAAAAALSNLGNDQERVRFIARELAVPIIVKVLADSPMKVQVAVANLVAKMVEMDPMVQEEFGRENVTRPLVTLLDTVLDDPTPKLQPGKPSLHSLVQINKELARDSFNHIPHSSSLSSLHKKERGVESPELKLDLKISCAKALWKLSRGSLLNSRKITETKGLLVLAKLFEKERGELQSNCLMAVMELVAVAETNTDFRRAAFKSNSPAAKAVLEQIFRVVNEESSLTLLIPAIRSLGSLARTFPAKESRIIGPLVAQLGHRNIDVASEAAIALGKFACPDNFNCLEHSKAIIDADGVSRLMNLIRISGRDQVNELTLLCFLALTVGNSKALEQARALGVIEGAARSVGTQHPDKRELFAKAIHHLTLYQAGDHTHRQAFAP